MIGTLLLAFIACMAIASLGLFALIRTGVIDQHMSLILFVAAVPLAAWVALGVEAADPDPDITPPDDQPLPIAQVDIERLWPRGFDQDALPPQRRLRPPSPADPARPASR
ncbi:MAG TPA: hypothetical protein VNS79_09680 [Sphingobium sp.]|nr:hypothetical protein [Sphingobium sp.]